MTIAILIDIILRDGLAPGGMTLELDTLDVDASIDDIHVNALTTSRVMLVESESSETKFGMVGDTSKTLEHSEITNHATKAGLRNIPMEQSTECQGREQLSLV